MSGRSPESDWVGADRVDQRWETKRGVETIDYNNSVVFVRGSIGDVAQALSPRATSWDRDVLDREIILDRCGCFVYRLEGHGWTSIVESLDCTIDEALGRGWEGSLSRALRSRLFRYSVSDTCGHTSYTLWEDGETIEEFDAPEGERGRPDPVEGRFRSSVRTLKIQDIPNIWGFVHQFFVEQDALEPGIEFGDFLAHATPGPGDRVVVRNPSFHRTMIQNREGHISRPKFDRIDYLTFGSIKGPAESQLRESPPLP